jgi:ribonuclease P protein component
LSQVPPRASAAFAAVFRNGRRFEGERLQLLAGPAAGPQGRVAFVIGKKLLARAVDRNRLKRMLRESVRSRRPGINPFDVVLRLRRPCSAAELSVTVVEARKLLDKLRSAGTEILR